MVLKQLSNNKQAHTIIQMPQMSLPLNTNLDYKIVQKENYTIKYLEM